jgi:hypothetical protein
MKDSFEGGEIIPHAVREKVNLPVACDTRWHWARGRDEADVGRLPRYLDPNYRSKTKRLQHAIGKLLDVLTGKAFTRPFRSRLKD